METAFDIESLEWKRVRPDVAQGVHGRTILSEETTITVTRVEPGGGFAAHRDSYGHLLYFLEGTGTVTVENEEITARAGLVVRVPAGKIHSYRNTGSDELALISVNIPTRR